MPPVQKGALSLHGRATQNRFLINMQQMTDPKERCLGDTFLRPRASCRVGASPPAQPSPWDAVGRCRGCRCSGGRGRAQ